MSRNIDLVDANLRTECYLAVMSRFQKQYPGAHFERITRADVNSPLSPEKDLLWDGKDGRIPWDEYLRRLEKQIRADPRAIDRMRFLRDLASSGKVVFLVCYEKDAMKCHRSLVKRLILGLDRWDAISKIESR